MRWILGLDREKSNYILIERNKNTRNKNEGGQENNKVGRQGTKYKEINTGMYKRSGERKTERRKDKWERKKRELLEWTGKQIWGVIVFKCSIRYNSNKRIVSR